MNNLGNWPYLAMLALIIATACAYLLSGIADSPPKTPLAHYPQGYFTRARSVGPMRVIPLGGNSLKSPLSDDPGAIFSPFADEEKR